LLVAISAIYYFEKTKSVFKALTNHASHNYSSFPNENPPVFLGVHGT